jgi:NitT/TauT family transport system ATP-binding protein
VTQHDPEKWKPVFGKDHAQEKWHTSESVEMGSTVVAEDSIVRFDEVSKSFLRPDRTGQFTAVDRLSFDIKRGEIVAVLGKTGCGKSTMFNLLSGLIEPSGGSVRVLGHDPFRAFDQLRGRIGIVFQNDRLMPWRTALDNVLLGLEILDRDPKEAEEVARRWLARLGLAGHENDYPHALSGGMRQRVSIARAFAVEPDILLCDEPFSSLDEMTARDLRQEFLRLVRQNGKTSVFITHHINEAMEIGDRILVFHRPARIAYETRMDAALRDSSSDEVRRKIMDVLAIAPAAA